MVVLSMVLLSMVLLLPKEGTGGKAGLDHMMHLKSVLQAAAQAERHHALAKLAELEGVLQQALDQRAQASADAQTHLTQLSNTSSELSAAQQQLQQQQLELQALQVEQAGTMADQDLEHCHQCWDMLGTCSCCMFGLA